MGLFMLTPSNQLVDREVEAVVPFGLKPFTLSLLTEKPFADLHGEKIIPVLKTPNQKLRNLLLSHQRHLPVGVRRTRPVKGLHVESLLAHFYL